eukprot:4126881-Pyramimonas_sp.AAC.1
MRRQEVGEASAVASPGSQEPAQPDAQAVAGPRRGPHEVVQAPQGGHAGGLEGDHWGRVQAAASGHDQEEDDHRRSRRNFYFVYA